jgi:hypothetical protein
MNKKNKLLTIINYNKSKKKNIKKIHNPMGISYTNIIHGGGKIDNIDKTNSLESILYNIKNNNNSKIFEIDVIKIKDHFVIAHNGTEKNYGFNGKFRNIDIDTYNNLKIKNKYTPMTFFKLKEIIKENPNYKFILDIKESGINYNNCLIYINEIMENVNDNLIPQAYNIEDLTNCVNQNFNSCLIALWKCNHNIYSQHTLKFINNLFKYQINIFGISIWFKNYNTENFKKYYSNLIYKIYFHGQILNINKIKNYNNIGVHFFA